MIARFVASIGLSLGLASGSMAAPITWVFEGTVRILVTGETPELASSLGVSLGAPVSGHLAYDDSVLSGGHDHDGAVLGFGFAIGNIESAYTSLGCCFFDANFDPASGQGSYRIFGMFVSSSLIPAWGSPAALTLIADAPGVIPNQFLPHAPPPLTALRPFSIADWSDPFAPFGTGLEIGFQGAENGWIVVELTSLALVPEPEAFALLAFAGIAIALRRTAA